MGGVALLAIERASDRVQVEAAATNAGFKVYDLADNHSNDEGPFTLIVDGASFADLSGQIPDRVEQVIAIGEGEIPPELEGNLEVRFLASTSISRSLSELLAGDAV